MPRSEPGLLVMCFYMVGLLGRRSQFYGLKVRCFTLKLQPHMVPPVRVELTLVGLRVRYATITSRRDESYYNVFIVPSRTIRSLRTTLSVYRVSCHSP